MNPKTRIPHITLDPVGRSKFSFMLTPEEFESLACCMAYAEEGIHGLAKTANERTLAQMDLADGQIALKRQKAVNRRDNTPTPIGE